MKIDFKLYNYDYSKRSGNLKVEAQGKVKSQKFFPYFYEDGKKLIFKPLSKTKPLSTPYFAYSEVVWSNILNSYFDKTIPVYRLAKCIGYEKEVPKYHDYGTVVESIVSEDETLVNLYEFFEKHPDSKVNIKDYINYCLKLYDYRLFFESNFFLENENLSREISKQILYSILRADQNYHYENVSLIFDGLNYKKVANPIDHEFSTMFMYLDQESQHNSLYEKYMSEFESCTIIEDDGSKCVWKPIILKNIAAITKKHPDLVEEFLFNLENMIEDLNNNPIQLEDNGYIVPFSSDDFEEGILRYKENKEKQADMLSKIIKRKDIKVEQVNSSINKEIIQTSKTLHKVLKKELIR